MPAPFLSVPFTLSVGCKASGVEGPGAAECFDSVAGATTLSTNGFKVAPDLHFSVHPEPT